MESDKRCKSAILAALELTSEICAGKKGKFKEIYPDVFVWVPDNPTNLSEGLTCEERIIAVAESDWAMNEAKGLVEKLFGIPPDHPEYEERVKRVAVRIAMGAVDCTPKVSIDELAERIKLH